MQQNSLDLRINEIKSEKDPLVQARLVAAIKQDTGISGVELARRLDLMPSHISHLLRVLRLPEMIVDGYMSKLVSFTHLIIISRLKEEEQALQLYEEILTKSMTISQTEHRVREIMYQIDSNGEYLSTEKLKSYEKRMSSSIGAQVSIIQTRIKCKITIELSGNLETTTQFIDELGSKFRSKRTSHKSTHAMVEDSHDESPKVETTPAPAAKSPRKPISPPIPHPVPTRVEPVIAPKPPPQDVPQPRPSLVIEPPMKLDDIDVENADEVDDVYDDLPLSVEVEQPIVPEAVKHEPVSEELPAVSVSPFRIYDDIPVVHAPPIEKPAMPHTPISPDIYPPSHFEDLDEILRGVSDRKLPRAEVEDIQIEHFTLDETDS